MNTYYKFSEELFDQIKNLKQYMQCKAFGCQNQATTGFIACSINHSLEYKKDVADYSMYADELLPLSNWYYPGLGQWSIEKMEYMYEQCS